MQQHDCYLTPHWPAPSNVFALTTVRSGGESLAPFNTFNIAAHVGDHDTFVQQNRDLLKHIAQLPEEPCWLKQVHGIEAIVLDEHTNNSSFPTADAALTRTPKKVTAVLTADCLPLLICDEKGQEVAAIHAGWRGLANGVIDSTLQKMHAKPHTLLVWLGPAISQKAFVVGEDVLQAFSHPLDHQAFIPHTQKNFWRADLYLLARLRLQALGVSKIYGGEYCTYTDEEKFYSYRRSQPTGRMASLIWFNT